MKLVFDTQEEKDKALLNFQEGSKVGNLLTFQQLLTDAAVALSEEETEEMLKDPAFNNSASCGCAGDLVCAVHSEKKIEDLEPSLEDGSVDEEELLQG